MWAWNQGKQGDVAVTSSDGKEPGVCACACACVCTGRAGGKDDSNKITD